VNAVLWIAAVVAAVALALAASAARTLRDTGLRTTAGFLAALPALCLMWPVGLFVILRDDVVRRVLEAMEEEVRDGRVRPRKAGG